jgi:nitrite reductase (NO-forming)/hydroxylamine reductase
MQKRIRGGLMLAALPLAMNLAWAAPATPAAAAAEPALSAEDKAAAGKTYFERCAGCHGMLRKGATGKNLEPANTANSAVRRLEKIMAYGTEGGMVNFDDILSKKEIANMAAYLQMPAEAPPEWSLADIKGSWKLLIPVAQRPTKQMNNVNLKNVFSVTLRDSGEVALIDGDTKKIWSVIKTGYAVHISRMSTSGRYVHVIGRDGRLRSDRPVVRTADHGGDAEGGLRSAFDRNVQVQGLRGQVRGRRLLLATAVHDSRRSDAGAAEERLDAGQHGGRKLPSGAARGVDHFASESKPEWVINIKETGMIKLVDYSDLANLKEVTINSAKFLHDGGWDSSKRYFLVAANASNKVAVVDTQEGKLAALVDTAKIPHPGRGANFKHPTYGPVWATSHLGADVISIIGTDPAGHPQSAWKVVQELKNHGANSLFVKTHPKSANLWADAPLNPDPKLAGSVSVYRIADLGKPDARSEVIDLAAAADLGKTKGVQRVVHGEYNEKGDEIWFSVWTGNKTEPSAIVVMDDKTRTVKTVIKDPRLVTPTGKFNVYNTMHDIY